MPHQGVVLEPWLDGEGVEEVRADHEVLGVDHVAMEVDELLGEVLGLVLEVLEVVLHEGQHAALLHPRWCLPLCASDNVADDNMTRGDRQIIAGGHDALEDLDLVNLLVFVLVLEYQAILINV